MHVAIPPPVLPWGVIIVVHDIHSLEFYLWYITSIKRQVSKDIVVAALITDQAGRVLIVKPDHKDGWIFPGGYVEVGEAPSSACHREIAAELGVEINGPNKLLSIDYRGQLDEYVMFIFDGGSFTNDMIVNIRLSPHLIEYRFVSPQEAMSLLRENSARRLMPTLDARNRTTVAYLEHQKLF